MQSSQEREVRDFHSKDSGIAVSGWIKWRSQAEESCADRHVCSSSSSTQSKLTLSMRMAFQEKE